MNDTKTEVEQLIDGRDAATVDATRALAAAVLDLRAVAGKTPYVTTVLTTAAEFTNALGCLGDVAAKLEHWLEVNAASCVRPSSTHDTDALVRDVRRELKGVMLVLSQQQSRLQHPVGKAWTLIGHREGVVGRETF